VVGLRSDGRVGHELADLLSTAAGDGEKKLAGLEKSVSRLERGIRTSAHRVADVPAKHARSTKATSTVKKPALKRTTGRRATTNTKATSKRAVHSPVVAR
jgi:hypothetical protein